MRWTTETGFEHFRDCLDLLNHTEADCNRNFRAQGIDKTVVSTFIDACVPEDFQNQNQKILVTNCWFEPGLLDDKYYATFSDSFYGMFAGTVPIEQTVVRKSFNCLVNRMDPVRQSWVYQLARRDLFDRGYVSFNMDISRHVATELCEPGTEPIEVFDQQFRDHMSIFKDEHEYLRPLMPYRNFDDDISLNQIIMQSKFSIILETYFDRNDVITYSEKIFRCLKLPRPWVMFAMQGAVKYLRDLGFDMLDDIVDHSYDQIAFAIDRQTEILNQAVKLDQQVLTTGMLERCARAAKHNQQLLAKLYEGYHETVNTTYSVAIHKCLKL